MNIQRRRDEDERLRRARRILLFGLGGGPSTPGFSLTAPVLSIVSGQNVAVPVLRFIVDDDIPAGYKIRVAASVNSDMSAPFETITNEITGTDLTDGQIDSDTPGYVEFSPMTSGAKYFQAVFLTDLDAQASLYSNIPTITLDITAPTITSAATANNAENSVLAHALTANESVTWSLNGGADAARFEISGSTLRWLSNGTKDFETPDDAGTNNVYNVTVRATDTAGNTTDQNIAVTVTDVGEGVDASVTYLGRAQDGGTNVTQIKTFSTVGPFGADALIVVGETTAATVALTSATINASGGNITCSLVRAGSTTTEDDRSLRLLQGVLPAGQTFTTITMVYGTNPFGTSKVGAWALHDLLSYTAVDADHLLEENDTVSTLDISTTDGGVIIAIGMSRNITSNSGALSGDESFTTRYNEGSGGIHVGGEALATSTVTNTNTITATFTQNGDQGVMAASWR